MRILETNINPRYIRRASGLVGSGSLKDHNETYLSIGCDWIQIVHEIVSLGLNNSWDDEPQEEEGAHDGVGIQVGRQELFAIRNIDWLC